MANETHLDATIAGGGILGLTLAWQLSRKFPHWEIALFEKEKYLGEHTSGRNSGVLHAGLYYPKNSLKHLLCLEGRKLWNEWAKQFSLPIKITGKYIVASSTEDLAALETLRIKAIDNGVEGIRMCPSSELAQLSSHLHVKDAFFCPVSGIMNVSELIAFFKDELYRRQVPILSSQEVRELQKEQGGLSFRAGGEKIFTSLFFNCAGLWADQLRAQLGLEDLTALWVKGNYLRYFGPAPLSSLVYPIPPQDGQGLGVHLTMGIDGSVRFGPDTQAVEKLDYGVASDLKERMWPSIAKLFKNIDPNRLSPDYSGIRPKIKWKEKLYGDFWIKGPQETGTPGYFEACGIESPGLTAAPALAKRWVDSL